MADADYIVDGVLTEGEAWVPLISTTLSGNATNVDFYLNDYGSGNTQLNASQYVELVMIGSVRQLHGGSGEYTGSMRCQFGSSVSLATAYYQTYWYGASQNGDIHTELSDAYVGYSASNSADADIWTGFISRFGPVSTGTMKQAEHTVFNDVNYQSTENQMTVTYNSLMDDGIIDMIRMTGNTPSGFITGSRFDLYGVLPRMVQ